MTRKILAAVICVFLALTAAPVSVFAESTNSTPAVAAVADETKNQAGITPDSFLYTFEKLIESVQVGVTFSEEGKAELLIEFANERLAEALIMTAKDNQRLAQKVMNTYAKTINKANSCIKTILDDDSKSRDPHDLIAKIEIVQGDAEKVAIRITGTLSEVQAEHVKTMVEAQVKTTLAVKAYAAVKHSVKDAAGQLAEAKTGLEKAKTAGDEAAVKEAEAKAAQAEAYFVQMKEVKHEAKELKNEVKKEQREICKEQREAYKEQREIMKAQKREAPKDHNKNKEVIKRAPAQKQTEWLKAPTPKGSKANAHPDKKSGKSDNRKY